MNSRITSGIGKLPKVDLRDKKILWHLSEDSRISFTKLAQKAHLSRDAVRYRIMQLEKKKIIAGFTVELDEHLFNINHYYVLMRTIDVPEEREQAFFTYIRQNPHIISVIGFSDEWDLLLEIVAHTVEEFDSIITQLSSTFPEMIELIDVFERVTIYAHTPIPQDVIDLNNTGRFLKKLPTPDIKLDATDRQILSLLSQDSRQSFHLLASKVSLSADAVIYRVKKLVSTGVIRRFTTECNLSYLGYSSYIFLMHFKSFSHDIEEKFRQIALTHPNIVSAVKTIGNYNVMVTIVSRDSDGFHKTVRRLRREFVASIGGYDTLLAREEYKHASIALLIGVP